MNIKILTILISILILITSCGRLNASLGFNPIASTSFIAQGDKDSIAVNNQYIIKRKGKAYLMSNAELQQLGITVLKSVKNLGIDLISASEQVIAQLKTNPDFAYIEPNYIRTIENIETIKNIPSSNLSVPSLNAGRSYISIAVLSTGIDYNHPDLSSKILPGYSTILDEQEIDQHGYGTLLSGLIVGFNKQMGLTSLAPECKIIPVKVINKEGFGNDFNIADGITWAVEHGAKVILLPVQGQYPSQVLKDAINYATLNNCSVVVPVTKNGLYPASETGVIAVSTSNNAQSISAYSGVRVSTLPTYTSTLSYNSIKSGYGVISGASVAAADVTALLALIYSQNPTISSIEAKKILETTSDANKINPVRALNYTKVRASSKQTRR